MCSRCFEPQQVLDRGRVVQHPHTGARCPKNIINSPRLAPLSVAHMCDLQWAECMDMDLRRPRLCRCQDVKVRTTCEVWVYAPDTAAAAVNNSLGKVCGSMRHPPAG
jgi:hypothetical protein